MKPGTCTHREWQVILIDLWLTVSLFYLAHVQCLSELFAEQLHNRQKVAIPGERERRRSERLHRGTARQRSRACHRKLRGGSDGGRGLCGRR